MLASLALLLLAPALAGSGAVEVTVSAPVVVVLDGQALAYEGDGTVARATAADGVHQLSIRTFAGQELWSGPLMIPSGYLVPCQWAQSQLRCADATRLGGAMQMQVSTLEGGAAVSVGMGPTGMSMSTSVTETSGETMSTEVGMGMTGMPFMGVAIDAQPAAETHAVHHHVHTAAPPPPQPVAPSRVLLVVRSTDGEWADVLVDGQVVLELYNDQEGQVWISPGTHTIEVKEFMEDVPYATGRLETAYAERITLGITENKPVVCYDHDGWWPR